MIGGLNADDRSRLADQSTTVVRYLEVVRKGNKSDAAPRLASTTAPQRDNIIRMGSSVPLRQI